MHLVLYEYVVICVLNVMEKRTITETYCHKRAFNELYLFSWAVPAEMFFLEVFLEAKNLRYVYFQK